MVSKKNIYKFYFFFLFIHLFLWTLIPSLTNVNLPLDTIEALAWGSNLSWGFNKHPPFSAFAVEFFYKIFGNQDWAYYLLSQLFVISAFIAVFNFAKDFFKSDYLAFLSVLLLESIFYYNYTSPEFNVNISQLPFWAFSIFFAWRSIKYDKYLDYIFLSLTLGLGILSKYIFLYLVLSIKLLFLYLLIKKKIKSYNFLIIGPLVLLIVLPHIFWLFDNNFITLSYGINRTGGTGSLMDHLIFPITFIFKQLIILLPFFIMTFFLINKFKLNKIVLDQKLIFLFFTFLIPLLFIFLTSMIMGAKLRTMWMTPFYLLAGVVIIQIFRKNINLNKIKKFYIVFVFFFLISPGTYALISLKNDFKRTDYPGKEIARLVQNRWDDNFTNEIKIVIGDEWFAGNLSYHLDSRPKWIIELKDVSKNLNKEEGVIYTGNPKILKNICPGVFGSIKPVGYCMIGIR